MSCGTGRKKEKHGCGEVYEKGENDGTAARTRPWSFNEIMSRRKNKKGSADDENEVKKAAPFSNNKKSVSVFKHDEYEDGDRILKVHPLSSLKHSSEDPFRSNFRKKEERYSLMLHKSSRRGPHGLEVKAAQKQVDDIQKNAKSGMHLKRSARRKIEKMHDSYGNESEKKCAKLYHFRDGHADGSKRNSQREFERDHHISYHDNHDIRSERKHDRPRLKNEIFSKNKESGDSSLHCEGRRRRKRRSRSSEHDKLREKRSASLSPSIVNRASYHQQGNENLASHAPNKWSGKHCSEIHESKSQNNGCISHYERHDISSDGLNSHSPRKKKSEITARTPSPSKFSPGKRIAAWDQPLEGTERSDFTQVLNPKQQIDRISSDAKEMSAIVYNGSTFACSMPVMTSNVLISLKSASVESIQLTQATRPMRRLYVENIPASISEKVLMESFNTFLITSGANHILGTQPCISCIMHKEKGQAFMEFLTPEDASAALSFDGKLLLGSVLKVRRPKDFVEGATGVPEKSSALSDVVSDTVMDSPHKIFITGISELLSSSMLMEIASAFGSLKAFRFQKNHGLEGPCAFVEYVDSSITNRACAGLNGLKVGGQVLTVLQTSPNTPPKDTGISPFYGFPEHANPLLEKPTEVLKLNNVLNKALLLTMTPAEVDETMEDVRLECFRFGAVRSINLVKYDSKHDITVKSNGSSVLESAAISDNMQSGPSNFEATKSEEINRDVPHNAMPDPCGGASEGCNGSSSMSDHAVEAERPMASPEGFDIGTVLVEFRRTEGSCCAAHCLHGRLFDDRTVTVDYVPLDIYRELFIK